MRNGAVLVWYLWGVALHSFLPVDALQHAISLLVCVIGYRWSDRLVTAGLPGVPVLTPEFQFYTFTIQNENVFLLSLSHHFCLFLKPKAHPFNFFLKIWQDNYLVFFDSRGRFSFFILGNWQNNTISMVRCWNESGQTFLKFRKLKNSELLQYFMGPCIYERWCYALFFPRYLLTSPPSSLQWRLLPGHHHRHGAHHEHVYRRAVRRHRHGESETFPQPSLIWFLHVASAG